MRREEMGRNSVKKFLQVQIYRMLVMRKTILIVSLICLVLGIFIGNKVGVILEQKKTKLEIETLKKDSKKEIDNLKETISKNGIAVSEEAAAEVVNERPWNLTLVNSSNPLAQTYIPELTEVAEGYSVDSRIAEPLTRMLNDAAAEGMQMYICSAYRNVEYQKEVFNQTMGDFIANGSTYYDAYDATSKSVAVPTTSEHALGLALDIVSREYELLDDRQAQTKEAQWLAANGYKYGFILRYPPDKMQETGIVYEPWHYRYVGEEAAKEITEKGVTFEEYLGEK